MTKKEILDRLTTELGTDCESKITAERTKQYYTLLNILNDTLAHEQKTLLEKLDEVNDLVICSNFHDGILFGIELAKKLNSLLDNPLEMLSEQPDLTKRIKEDYNELLKDIQKAGDVA